MSAILLSIAIKVTMTVDALQLVGRGQDTIHFVAFAQKQMSICRQYEHHCTANEHNIDEYVKRLFNKEELI